MTRFALFGIPVVIQPWFALIAVYLGYVQVDGDQRWVEKLVVWVAVMFTGVLAHELGHACMGKAFGLMPRIQLHGMGGLTHWEGGRVLSPWRGVAVSLAGPLVGIMSGGAALLAGSFLDVPLLDLRDPGANVALYGYVAFVWVNLGWGLLNLLPMMPLDGGNVMAHLFELVSKGRGRLLARYLSLLAAAGLLAWSVSNQALVLALIVLWLAWTNFRGLRVEQQIGLDMPHVAELSRVQKLISTGHHEAAIEAAEALRPQLRTPAVRSDLVQLLGWAHLLNGDPGRARLALASSPEDYPPDPGLRGAVRLASGDPHGALDSLEDAIGRSGGLVEEAYGEAVAATGDFERAARLLSSSRGHRVQPSTLARIEEAAYRTGAFGAAARFGELLFDREGRAIRAFNVACSLVRAGEFDQALKWLVRARKAGFEQTELLDTDEDLAPLRGRPGWAAFRARFD